MIAPNATETQSPCRDGKGIGIKAREAATAIAIVDAIMSGIAIDRIIIVADISVATFDLA